MKKKMQGHQHMHYLALVIARLVYYKTSVLIIKKSRMQVAQGIVRGPSKNQRLFSRDISRVRQSNSNCLIFKPNLNMNYKQVI